MKLITKLLIGGSLIAALGSCKKDNPTPDNNLTYKMDGVLKTAKPDVYSYTDNTLMIDGTKGSEDITLFVDTIVNAGTFHIGNMSDKITAMYVNWDNLRIYDSNTGTLVISSFDGTSISGTFSFTASNGGAVKNFTNGQFTAKVANVSYCLSDTTRCDTANMGLAGREKFKRMLKTQQTIRLQN